MENFRQELGKGKQTQAEWQKRFAVYEKQSPDLAAEFKRRLANELPANWDASLPTFAVDPKGMMTRKASETVMQALAKTLPELVGGSADLNPSTFTWLKGEGDFEPPQSSPEGAQGTVGGAWGYVGRNLHFGVREHGMGAIVNGLALHGGIRPYSATFFVFSDYMRPTLRLAAISELPSIFVFTHDSIGLGEDGPTHQPVEHLAAVRAIPDVIVLRPADANETTEAWRMAINHKDGPVILVFSRQAVAILDRSKFAPASGVAQGAYVLNPSETAPDVILMSTGSEVELIVKAAETLAGEGIKARLVSMPSWEIFDKQPQAYQDSVLPPNITARVAIEAGVRLGWDRWLGDKGHFIGLARFGASAPAKVVYEKFGITAEAVVKAAHAAVGR